MLPEGFQIRPLDDRLVVEPLPQDEGTLIQIPDSAKGPYRRGRVIAVGPGKLVRGKKGNYRRYPMACQAGQIVQFGQYSIDAEVDGLLLIREGDVLVVEN